MPGTDDDGTPPLRELVGDALRGYRVAQGRTLRDVAQAAQVSVPYLSEVERGRKEASSEVLAAVCRGLGVRLSDLLEQVRRELVAHEAPRTAVPARTDPRVLVPVAASRAPGPGRGALTSGEVDRRAGIGFVPIPPPASRPVLAGVPAADAEQITLAARVDEPEAGQPPAAGPTCLVGASSAQRARRGRRRPGQGRGDGPGHLVALPAPAVPLPLAAGL